jgi:hypothetical protein
MSLRLQGLESTSSKSRDSKDEKDLKLKETKRMVSYYKLRPRKDNITNDLKIEGGLAQYTGQHSLVARESFISS